MPTFNAPTLDSEYMSEQIVIVIGGASGGVGAATVAAVRQDVIVTGDFIVLIGGAR
jgi:NADP-dependent 3-hydroxy acid dehydrogenase YdfG